MNGEQNPWTTIDSTEVYKNKWITLTHHNVITPTGTNGVYGKVHFHNRAIGVFVLDEEQHTYLVGQYRYPIDKYSWEMPEGGAPLDEGPLEAAKRELKEETGLTADDWTELIQMHLSNSVSDEQSIIYLARSLSQHEAAPEDTEELIVKRVPFDEAYQMLEDGIITDSMTVAALIKVKLLLLEGKL